MVLQWVAGGLGLWPGRAVAGVPPLDRTQNTKAVVFGSPFWLKNNQLLQKTHSHPPLGFCLGGQPLEFYTLLCIFLENKNWIQSFSVTNLHVKNFLSIYCRLGAATASVVCGIRPGSDAQRLGLADKSAAFGRT